MEALQKESHFVASERFFSSLILPVQLLTISTTCLLLRVACCQCWKHLCLHEYQRAVDAHPSFLIWRRWCCAKTEVNCFFIPDSSKSHSNPFSRAARVVCSVSSFSLMQQLELDAIIPRTPSQDYWWRSTSRFFTKPKLAQSTSKLKQKELKQKKSITQRSIHRYSQRVSENIKITKMDENGVSFTN